MSAAFRLTELIPDEDELHDAVRHALAVLAPSEAVINTWELRNAASAIEGARRKRLGALPGWPDLGVFWQGHVALLELKRRRHGQLSAAQRELHPRLAAQGFPVSVCRSVPEALAAVRSAGIPLRGSVVA